MAAEAFDRHRGWASSVTRSERETRLENGKSSLADEPRREVCRRPCEQRGTRRGLRNQERAQVDGSQPSEFECSLETILEAIQKLNVAIDKVERGLFLKDKIVFNSFGDPTFLLCCDMPKNPQRAKTTQ